MVKMEIINTIKDILSLVRHILWIILVGDILMDSINVKPVILHALTWIEYEIILMIFVWISRPQLINVWRRLVHHIHIIDCIWILMGGISERVVFEVVTIIYYIEFIILIVHFYLSYLSLNNVIFSEISIYIYVRYF